MTKTEECSFLVSVGGTKKALVISAKGSVAENMLQDSPWLYDFNFYGPNKKLPGVAGRYKWTVPEGDIRHGWDVDKSGMTPLQSRVLNFRNNH